MTRGITVLPVKPPFILHVLRAVLLVWGVLVLILTIDGAMHRRFFIDITVLNLFAGTLLLRGSRSWRLVVLGELWYLFIACVILLCLVAGRPGPVRVYLFDGELTVMSRAMAMSTIASVMIVGVWMHVVLCLPKVRAYFYSRPWSLIDPSVVRVVERLDGMNGRVEHDVISAQMGALDRAISRLEGLREDLAGPDIDQVVSEARQKTDDLLARAIRVREAHLAGGVGESSAPES